MYQGPLDLRLVGPRARLVQHVHLQLDNSYDTYEQHLVNGKAGPFPQAEIARKIARGVGVTPRIESYSLSSFVQPTISDLDGKYLIHQLRLFFAGKEQGTMTNEGDVGLAGCNDVDGNQ